MTKKSLKNKFLVGIMVLVLLGALFIPSGVGAENGASVRANPSISVAVSIDSTPDVNGNYANASHDLTVTVTNDGAEELSNIVLGLTIFNGSGPVEKNWANDTSITTLNIGESVSVAFTAWNPTMGDGATYYAIANAMADAFPSQGVEKMVYGTHNMTGIMVNDTTDGYAMGAGFDGAVAYMEGSMPYYANLTYPSWPVPTIMIMNNGSTPLTNVDVWVQIYNVSAGPGLAYEKTATVSGPIAVGGSTVYNMAAWDDHIFKGAPVMDQDYFMHVTINTTDMDATNNFYNFSFRIQNVTDVMPMGIISHMSGEQYNSSAQVFTARVKNSGNMPLTESFNVTLLIYDNTGKQINSTNKTVTTSELVNPGDSYDVEFNPVMIPVSSNNYSARVLTKYANGNAGPDDNVTNNATAHLPFFITDNPAFNIDIMNVESGKINMRTIAVNANVTNTGNRHTDDEPQMVLALTIFDTNFTAIQTDDVIVFQRYISPISLGPGESMEYIFPQWNNTDQYTGKFRIYVNLTGNIASDFEEVEFPDTMGYAHFMVMTSPAGGTITGATIKVMDGSTELATGSLPSNGEETLNVVPGTGYTASVSNVYNYADDSATGVDIIREVKTTIQLTMNKISSFTLNGTVTDQDGNPVEGATVHLVTTKMNPPGDQLTDADGFYNMGEVETGDVWINVTKAGYMYTMTNITITANGTLDVVLNIIPAPVSAKVDVDGTMTALNETVVTGVSVDTMISVMFDMAVNSSTVASQIKLMRGTSMIAMTPSFSINDTMMFNFTPDSDLLTETMYTLMIGKDIKKYNSTELWYYGMSKNFSFETEAPGVFNVMGYVYDSDNTTLRSPVPGATVAIALNATVSLTDVTASDGSFTIENVPVGTHKVAAQDVMFFGVVRYSAAGTMASTNVDIVDSDVTLTIDLVVIEQDLPVKVETPASMTDVAVDTNIMFTFEESMDVTSVEGEASLTKTLGGNPVAGTWLNATAENMTFTFDPTADLDYNESYTLTITGDVLGNDTEKVLWKEFTFTFTTKMGAVVPDLTATITTSTLVDGVITVEFNAKMDQTKTNAAIMITADDDATSANKVTTYSWDTAGMKVTLDHDNFEYETAYTVTVSTAAETSDGRTLAAAKTAMFTTEMEPPVQKFTLILGPFTDSDNNFIEGAKVTITIDGKEYSGTTNSAGVVTIELDEQPANGKYKVKVTKDGYKDYEYDLEITDGLYNPVPPGKMEKSGSMTLILIIVIIVIIIIVVMVALAMRKKPAEEEAAEEEGEEGEEEEAGEFECPACGALVSSEEKICPECGEEFEEEEFKCPECGAPIEPDATTCEACGAEFELEEEGEEGEEGEGEEDEEEYEVEGEEEEGDEGEEEFEEGEEDLEEEGEEGEEEFEEGEEDLEDEGELEDLDEDEEAGEEDLEEGEEDEDEEDL